MKGIMALTVASLIVATGGAARAETAEHTYLAPFQAAEGYLWGCDAPWCEGSISAEESGTIVAEVLSAGVSRFDSAQGIVTVTHVVEEPATLISLDVRFHVEDAYASAFGAPAASATASVGVEAWPTHASWAYRDVKSTMAIAGSPLGEEQAGEQDVTLSLTLGDGKRLIQGPISITVPVVAEATSRPEHAPAAAAACAGQCVSAGRAEARIAATVQSVTVREKR